MIEAPSIQWFPGHMAKTRRLIQQNLKLVDLVVELADARIPVSSRNPELDRWIERKPRILLLNKSSLADERVTQSWCAYFKSRGIPALAVDSVSGRGFKGFVPLVREELSELLKRREAKGMAGRPVRLMIVGIPNVGKSSFINKIAGGKYARVEDRPGVTRTKQWISFGGDLELMDMPGVLWPKFDDKTVGEHLAFTGAVKDDVVDIELLAMRLLQLLAAEYPAVLPERYGIVVPKEPDGYELLCAVGKKRGMLVSGGGVNTERAAITVLDEFRAGKLGRITLEKPPAKR
ncbi:MAG: ribosome biogenesis GTPase YlqF [Oscillospiraceae bacterium]|nr:ribosome biogenesis GTPase YlqF [Oscillospiraceae bacterium]